ncbi:efflux RND transporter periplasmic adaptor subunit [Spirochaeta isovalerica]|uniref:HlyD family secretion protein n=1 Tax=Spirochaeta isovalerica TaxID=150 RepID=A0A841R757_9SPIO|nr:hypothetical protein [Spirochaeta isovalerica]MBB6479666.1 HlyD family secretion protein [Spirochaeta isovalerica]
MDRAIRKKKFTAGKIFLLFLALVLTVFLGKFLFSREFYRTGRAKLSRITISTVSEENISREIRSLGTVEPESRVVIEADEGGKVDAIFQASGVSVSKGTPILRLKNEVLEQELEKLIQSREEEKLILALSSEEFKRRELEFRQRLLEIDFILAGLVTQVEIDTRLYESGGIAREKLSASRVELDFRNRKKELFISVWESEKTIAALKEELQKRKLQSIENSLTQIRRRIERLTVCSPVSGILNLEDLFVGRNINTGEAIGAIDKEGDFKMTAYVDEFYLPLISIGDKASFSDGDAELSSISPVVRDGRIRLDFFLLPPLPGNLISGQTFTLSIKHGVSQMKMIVSDEGFYRDTAGSWVFKLVDDHTAMKTAVDTGLKNGNRVEILSGLEKGDRVIVSSYSDFLECDKIILSGEI